MFTVRPLSVCEVPLHLANALRNVYLKKSIGFVWERIFLRILVPGIVIVGMQPHSSIGSHYTVDSSDVMYQLKRNRRWELRRLRGRRCQGLYLLRISHRNTAFTSLPLSLIPSFCTRASLAMKNFFKIEILVEGYILLDVDDLGRMRAFYELRKQQFLNGPLTIVGEITYLILTLMM